MEELLDKLGEILETPVVDLNKKFSDYDEWDSLSSLAIIALLDSDYKLNCTYEQLQKFGSISEFCDFILKNGE